MAHRLLAACGALVLLQTSVLADTQYIGVVSMYLCDDGLDLCSNTLPSSPVYLSPGYFSETFVFDFVNDFINVPDNVPLLKATASLGASSTADFNSASVMLYNPGGSPFGFNTPFVPNGTNYQAQAEDLIHPGAGYYVQVSGISNIDRLPLEVSVSAFDLGSVDPSPAMPEPSTWVMMLLGIAGLGLAARRQTRPTG
jgi:PEP-CTERM motif